MYATATPAIDRQSSHKTRLEIGNKKDFTMHQSKVSMYRVLVWTSVHCWKTSNTTNIHFATRSVKRWSCKRSITCSNESVFQGTSPISLLMSCRNIARNAIKSDLAASHFRSISSTTSTRQKRHNSTHAVRVHDIVPGIVIGVSLSFDLSDNATPN